MWGKKINNVTIKVTIIIMVLKIGYLFLMQKIINN